MVPQATSRSNLKKQPPETVEARIFTDGKRPKKPSDLSKTDLFLTSKAEPATEAQKPGAVLGRFGLQVLAAKNRKGRLQIKRDLSHLSSASGYVILPN